MCAAKLEEALKDCIINFDTRVLLTDLINEYHMPIEEISSTLTKYLKQQEKEGTKYEKRFVIHGIEKEDATKEVFTIVKGETKLKEWLSKLKDAESSLYSVEIAGGAKAPAEDLKPVTWCAIKIENLQTRVSGAKQFNGDVTKSNASASLKLESKSDVKQSKGLASAFTKTKPSNTTDSTTSTNAKNKDAGTSKPKAETKPSSSNNTSKPKAVAAEKTSPQAKVKSEIDAGKKTSPKTNEQKKLSPKDKKAAAAASGQKGIGNFFVPKGKNAAETTSKAATGVIRQKSPQKLNDFFKKQTDTKEALKNEEKKANTSAQLFDDDDEDEEKEDNMAVDDEAEPVEVHVESSDEEEEINKLRRKVIEAEREEAATSSRKRLRIEDSDDEDNEVEQVDEQPQAKQGKLDEAVVTEIEDTPLKSETYLDDDGFVITIKSKTRAKPATTAAAARQKTPKKSSPKESKSKPTPTPAAKTKQGNIMNFFKKK
ncbi:DNA polymerase delta subunit 3 [Zeugodacus cucurbitae]|uniref:DNA polymerase delta subunit 3 n=1 Tax=Zeugodacus cucurbitae TaxID=28588 RepID=UPI0023D8F1B6|nr:DNA polymerase delta subunit 3 [Zeugodacus cucurbitae]